MNNAQLLELRKTTRKQGKNRETRIVGSDNDEKRKEKEKRKHTYTYTYRHKNIHHVYDLLLLKFFEDWFVVVVMKYNKK